MLPATEIKNDNDSDASASANAVVIGNTIPSLQVALTLAQMGIRVSLVTDSVSLGWDNNCDGTHDKSFLEERFFWPLLLRVIEHPLVTCYFCTKIEEIEGDKGNLRLKLTQNPRYVNQELCTGCGRCQDECSGISFTILDDQKILHTTIHKPLVTTKGIPSAYAIDKKGFAPCRVACPLGIKVQGFVSLLAAGKTDAALELINEAAPLAGILGRVCRHPCEGKCTRSEVDTPVSIRALHRYAADNASGGIKYKSIVPLKSRQEKIAVVGSGPSGITAAWDLLRRGYLPTIFESHGVIGGMLATGIPRFRLPREVREKEIEAIRSLGVDIRTGITVGRDVDFAYLWERGFMAFFLGIGAQRNNKLNIPGEDLIGVVDCMSLLRTLNLMVDTVVGANIVIIGDGNSAIDSARAAIRKNKGAAKVISWTVPEELTAEEEEVKEALMEGVTIESNTMPLEILGEGNRVVGIRCQRTELTEEIMPNGRHRPRPIPGTDFVIDADHVVVAIGQSPDAAQLDLEELAVDSRTGVIKVDPLTLETSVLGVFAGGDCITGPNNVVEAMAAGLRAAESIDRYIQMRDLREGRSLEPLTTAEVNIETIDVPPHKREPMPTISLQKRLSTLEETTTGLSREASLRESQRCLKCALCSHCMQCVRVCQLGAVSHTDELRSFEVEAQTVIQCTYNSSATGNHIADVGDRHISNLAAIQTISFDRQTDLTIQLEKAMAAAVTVGIEISANSAHEAKEALHDSTVIRTEVMGTEPRATHTHNVGVFLCSCGDSLSSIIDFKAVGKKVSELAEVAFVYETKQACTETGALELVNKIESVGVDQVVVAACRCCNLEQVCYSCTDRRLMCQQNLKKHLRSRPNAIMEFVNIREQCAWIHKDDPKGATSKAVQMISAGAKRVALVPIIDRNRIEILPAALILGDGLAGITAAGALSRQGYQVVLLACHSMEISKQKLGNMASSELDNLREKGVIVKHWPDSLQLHGHPGNYEALLNSKSQSENIQAGVILVDCSALNFLSPSSAENDLLGRILSETPNDYRYRSVTNDFLHEVTIGRKSGVFLIQPGDDTQEDNVLHALAATASAISFLTQREIVSCDMAVEIDKRLCRGCGDCATVCSYITMQDSGSGILSAHVDQSLCVGCGACLTSCSVGAIVQPLHDDKQIISVVHSMLL